MCLARDPKGIYSRARDGVLNSVPGLQAAYEPPVNPDVLVYGDTEAPEAAARRVIAKLIENAYL